MPPARSYWLQEALAADGDVAPRLEGEARADVCIVGGGFCGLWTAIHLKEREPSLDVAIVEADICGGGASGRNGGFVMTWWVKFPSLRKLCGTDEALRLAEASERSVAEIGRFCARHGIDAHFRNDGWLWTATSEAQRGAWGDVMEEAARHQRHPFREIEAGEVAARSGSPENIAGVFEAAAATVQPALLARGLRRHALDRGVRIYERSPMTRLDRARPPLVRTARGQVRAGAVVLALNAWGARFPELRRHMVVVASDMVVTRPMADRLAATGPRDAVALSDSRLFVHYWRTTLDGRIAFGRALGRFAFGGRVGRRFEGPSPRADEVKAQLDRLYPHLSDVPMEASWTGPIDKSDSGLPFFGHLGGREDIVYGVGFSGNGVGPSHLAGRILASLATGRDDEWAGSGLVEARLRTFPPEPVRYLGAHLVRGAILRKERAEDQGRTAGPLTARLAALGPAGLVPIAAEDPPGRDADTT